jgi:tetratricopeptide (TPR) repeat protein
MALVAVFMAAGCDRMMTPRGVQIMKDADQKASQGDYLRAINLYEAALDDSSRCAEIHYKLGLLYDDKMNDPLNALHHFKRYLILSPEGPHAEEVKKIMKRDEVMLATTFAGDGIVTRAEAARLRNENFKLRKEIEELTLKPKAALAKGVGGEAKSEKKEAHAGPTTYVVRRGDTLYSISRKFYQSSRHWKKIRDANRDKIGHGTELQPGETLTIP